VVQVKAATVDDVELDAAGWPATYQRQRNGLGVRRLTWAAGWDRSRACPPDPKNDDAPRGGWREVGLVAETPDALGRYKPSGWRRAHGKRRRAVRLLRMAGYESRKRWARERVGLRQVGAHLVDDWRYVDGPSAGLQAVDPWDVARKLQGCGSAWDVQIRVREHADPLQRLVPLPLPRLCGLAHVCPVCAGIRSRALARSLRAVVAAEPEDRRVFFLTLTQRADAGETLQDALTRWRGAWSRMTRGRPGRAWRDVVKGYYYGLEVTRGAGASEVNPGPWWHVHAHAVVTVPAHVVDVAAELGPLWHRATVAEAAGLGWEPVAGIKRPTETHAAAAARYAAGDWSGPWCQELDTTDPELREVGQATKYATPVATLHPLPLAEFLSTAHGRRWHQGGGEWRSVVRMAEELDAVVDAVVDDGEAADRVDRVDLGRGVCGMAPGEAPRLDDVARGLGTSPELDDVARTVSTKGDSWFRLLDDDAAWDAVLRWEEVGLARWRSREVWVDAVVVDDDGRKRRTRKLERQTWASVPTYYLRERMGEVLGALRGAREAATPRE